MTRAESIAAALPFACLVVALFRARLVALALTPSCLGIVVMLVGVDLSSASHPLRWVVPIATATLAGFAGWHYARAKVRWMRRGAAMRRVVSPVAANVLGPLNDGVVVIKARAALASLLILGSCAPDLLALHPWFWRFTEWALVPIQIAVCSTVLAVLLAPERWVRKWPR